MIENHNEPFKRAFTINGETKEALVVITHIIGYDEQERTVYIKYSNGRERWFEYDENGKRISTTGPVVAKEKDERGNVIYEKRQSGSETWFEYDADGRLAHEKQSNGYEEWHEYSESGHVIHKKSRVYPCFREEDAYRDANKKYYDEEWWEYDAQGKLRCVRTPDGYILETTGPDGYEVWNAYFDWQTLREDENGKQIYGKHRITDLEEWKDYDAQGRLRKVHRKEPKPCEDDDYDLPYETLTEYDERGHETYFKRVALSGTYEKWTEYDERGNEIHYKDSDGDEKWQKFDEQGREIYSKDFGGLECWHEYDERGNTVHYKDSDGNEKWQEYDEHGREIYSKERKPAGFIETWREYHAQGGIAHYKTSDGYEEWNDYSESGKEVHFRNSYGEEWREYNDDGKMIHYKNTDGKELWYDYDANGNQVYEKHSDGLEKWWDCDEDGNRLHYKDTRGNEWWCEYVFRADGTLERQTTYYLADCPAEKAKRRTWERRRRLQFIELDAKEEKKESGPFLRRRSAEDDIGSE